MTQDSSLRFSVRNIGSGDGGELTFLDIVSLASFFVGLENLDMNLTQDDKQDLQRDLSEKSDTILTEIHKHLEDQDSKLNWIMEKLNEKN